MKTTILLTGMTGQVGSELLRLLPELGEVVAPSRHELDVVDTANIQRIVRQVRPQLIVNAAANTAVDRAESDQALAHSVNAMAPGVLAEEAKRCGSAIVHYSTDYVFDGSKKTPYEETDLPNPINVYGKTKLAGEQAVRAAGVPHLIFRSSWIYATHGHNFLLTILRLATEREELRIVRDQIGAPTWSREIAATTANILAQLLGQNDTASAISPFSGTYHMTAAGETTWYDFTNSIFEQAARVSSPPPWFDEATGGRHRMAKRIIPITTAEYPTPASRPAYSVLSNSRLNRTFSVELSDWRTQLQRAFSTAYGVNRLLSAENPSGIDVNASIRGS